MQYKTTSFRENKEKDSYCAEQPLHMVNFCETEDYVMQRIGFSDLQSPKAPIQILCSVLRKLKWGHSQISLLSTQVRSQSRHICKGKNLI